MSTDNLAVVAMFVKEMSCAPASDVTVPVVVELALDMSATKYAVVEPVTFKVFIAVLAMVTLCVVEEPEVEPVVATFIVSIPSAVIVGFEDVPTPFNVIVIESVEPETTDVAGVMVVFALAPVTFNAGIAFKPVTVKAAVEPLFVIVVTLAMPEASTVVAPVAVAVKPSTLEVVTPAP